LPSFSAGQQQLRCKYNTPSNSGNVYFFSLAFIFWNNSGLTNLQRLSHALFHVLRGPRPQDGGAPLPSAVLTSEFDQGPGKGLHMHRQSNLPPSLHRPWMLQSLYPTIQCLQRAPGRSVTEKSQLFHTYRRSSRDRGSNPGHRRGGQRH
jgi:hypothetical protein